MGDVLKRKIEQRPNKERLIAQHILLNSSDVDPSLVERQEQLKRCRLVDNLNDRLSHRPGPLDLVKDHILRVESTELQKDLQDGRLSFKSTPAAVHRFVNIAPCASSSSSVAVDWPPPKSVAVARLTCRPATSQHQHATASTTCKPTAIKFHEYKGPPPPKQPPPSAPANTMEEATAVSTTGRSSSVGPPPPAVSTTAVADSTYESILEQQKILLGYQQGNDLAQLEQGTHLDDTGDTKTAPHSSEEAAAHRPPCLTSACSATTATAQQKTSDCLDDVDAAPADAGPNKTDAAAGHECTCGRQTVQLTSGARDHTEDAFEGHCATQTPAKAPAPPTTLAEAASKQPPTAAPQIVSKLADLKVSELKAECKKRSLPVSGPKPNLLERLKPYEDYIAASSSNRRSSVDSIEVTSNSSVVVSHTSSSAAVSPTTCHNDAAALVPPPPATTVPPIQTVISDFLRAHSLSDPSPVLHHTAAPPSQPQRPVATARAANLPPPPNCFVVQPPTPGSADFSSDTSGVASNYSSPGVDIGGLSFNPGGGGGGVCVNGGAAMAPMLRQPVQCGVLPTPPVAGTGQPPPGGMPQTTAANDRLNELAAAVTASALSEHEGMLRRQQQKIEELQRELQGSQDQLRRQQQVILAAKKTQCVADGGPLPIPRKADGTLPMTSPPSLSGDPSTDSWLAQLDTKQLQKFHIQLFLQHKLQQQQLQQQITLQQELAATQARLQEELGVQSAMNEVVRLLKQDPRVAVLIVQLLRKFQAERMQQQRENANFVLPNQANVQAQTPIQNQQQRMTMGGGCLPSVAPSSVVVNGGAVCSPPEPSTISADVTTHDDSQPTAAKLSKGSASSCGGTRTAPKQARTTELAGRERKASPTKKHPASAAQHPSSQQPRVKASPRKTIKSLPSSPCKAKEAKTSKDTLAMDCVTATAAPVKPADPVHMEEIFKAVLESVSSTLSGDSALLDELALTSSSLSSASSSPTPSSRATAAAASTDAVNRLPSCEQFMLPIRQDPLLLPAGGDALEHQMGGVMHVDEEEKAPSSLGRTAASSFHVDTAASRPPPSEVAGGGVDGCLLLAEEARSFTASFDNHEVAFDDLMEVLRGATANDAQPTMATPRRRLQSGNQSQHGYPSGPDCDQRHTNNHHQHQMTNKAGGIVVAADYSNSYGSQELGQLLGPDWMTGVGSQSSLLPPFGAADQQLGFHFEPMSPSHCQANNDVHHPAGNISQPVSVPQQLPVSENCSGSSGDAMDWLDLILPSPTSTAHDHHQPHHHASHVGMATPPYSHDSSSNPVLGQRFVKHSREAAPRSHVFVDVHE